MTATEHRELRADAQRNLQRVLDAARAVFAEQGVDAHMDEIARRAGVGVGTIFRRFPTKDALLAALLEQRGRELLAGEDATFESFVTTLVDSQIADRAFCDSVGTHVFAQPRVRALFDDVLARLGRLLDEAKAEGAVREDVTVEDVTLVVHGVAHVGLMLESAAHGVWRRYLRLALDGLRPCAATPLPRRAPTQRQFAAARGARAAARGARASR
ncbi:MAG TPA: helix-turn-helix domain-containing protein [Gaiellaceae bacterium]|nr:helix-turn-helix domain-containing protein [Gaiellaceae bacterium]